MSGEAISKLARHLEVGDVIETEDGFELCHSRVDAITYLDPMGVCDVKVAATDVAHYSGGEWTDRNDAGEFLFDPDETVEVIPA